MRDGSLPHEKMHFIEGALLTYQRLKHPAGPATVVSQINEYRLLNGTSPIALDATLSSQAQVRWHGRDLSE